jgi:hypothetical protein
MDDDQTPIWLPLGEASQRLDTTVDALRKQIRRGRLQSRKGNDGRLLVLVTGGRTLAGHVQDNGQTLASHVRDDGRTVASLLDRLDQTRLDLERSWPRPSAPIWNGPSRSCGGSSSMSGPEASGSKPSCSS